MQLTADHYERIAHLFPKYHGRLTYSNLGVLKAILYIAEYGAKWRRLLKNFGHWHTSYARSGPAFSVSAEVKIEPLRITGFQALGAGFYTVSFPTGIAQNYVIEQAASPAGPWQNKTSVITGTGKPVDELLLFSSLPRAYFRVRVYQSPPASPAVLTP